MLVFSFYSKKYFWCADTCERDEIANVYVLNRYTYTNEFKEINHNRNRNRQSFKNIFSDIRLRFNIGKLCYVFRMWVSDV